MNIVAVEIPNSVAMAVPHVEDDRLLVVRNETEAEIPHALRPLQTPQLSIVPSQHSPATVSAVPQQTPVTSTATPDPSHTPHASKTPDSQQAPLPSIVADGLTQQRPVESITVVQHWSHISTMPPGQSVSVMMPGIVQPSPYHPQVHSQTPLVHVKLPVNPQSAGVSQPHSFTFGAHTVDDGGGVMLSHDTPDISSDPRPVMHDTDRFWKPM